MLMRTSGALREVRLAAILAAVVGSAVFAVVTARAEEGGVYRCCTKSTDCRYVDNDKGCTGDAACQNNGDYKICCKDELCTRSTGGDDGGELLLN